MIGIPETAWRTTLAQCACSIKGSSPMSDDIAISSALSIMDKCGLQLEGNPDMRNTVEPPKCPICKAYIWPHEEKTGDKHKRCYDGVVFKSQANR